MLAWACAGVTSTISPSLSPDRISTLVPNVLPTTTGTSSFPPASVTLVTSVLPPKVWMARDGIEIPLADPRMETLIVAVMPNLTASGMLGRSIRTGNDGNDALSAWRVAAAPTSEIVPITTPVVALGKLTSTRWFIASRDTSYSDADAMTDRLLGSSIRTTGVLASID